MHPLQNIKIAVAKLAQMDPQDEAVAKTVEGIQEQISLLSKVDKPAGDKNSHGKGMREDDVDFMKEQINKLHQAAVAPLKNYRRIATITDTLGKVAELAARPQNAAVRPQIMNAIEKIAGVFSQVDTVADLDKPLEQIEKAVAALYGDQSSNSSLYFERRGKGHHTKSE